MSTRFVRIINVNGTHTQIELIRDGFNIWYPDLDTNYDFSAKYERVFSQPLWVYQDNALGDNVHRAMFETEIDVTAYMTWRIQRHLSSVPDSAATDTNAPETMQPDYGIPATGEPVKTGKPYPTEDIERIEELMTDNFAYGVDYEEWLKLHTKYGDNITDVFDGTSWTVDEVVDKMLCDFAEMYTELAELGTEYRALKADNAPAASDGVYSKHGTMLVSDAISALAHHINSDPTPKDFAEARTEIERYTANHEYAFEPIHCTDCNQLSRNYTTDDGIFCSACYDKRYGVTPLAENEATGEYRGMNRDDYSYIYRDDELLFIGVLTENSVINLLRTETSHLRAENTRLQKAVEHSDNSANLNAKKVIDLRQERDTLSEKYEMLERELEVSRLARKALEARIAELERVIDDAHTLAINIGDTDHHQDGRLHNVGMLRDFLESHLKDTD